MVTRFVGPDNLRDMPSDVRAQIGAVTVDAIDAFGEDPCTRAQVAAHEAGHVVIAWAYGQARSASITPQSRAGQRTRWTGRSGSGASCDPFIVRSNPEKALQFAAVTLAGFFGEYLVGLAHPASSIDERSVARLICEQLDDLQAEPSGTHAARVAALVNELLHKHRAQFDVIRGWLASQRRVSKRQVADIFARAQATNALPPRPTSKGGAQ